MFKIHNFAFKLGIEVAPIWDEEREKGGSKTYLLFSNLFFSIKYLN